MPVAVLVAVVVRVPAPTAVSPFLHGPSVADVTQPSRPGTDELLVRDAGEHDIAAMAAIYDDAVRTSVATFDLEARGAAYLTGKLAHVGSGNHLLVAELAGDVVGYALSAPFRERPAYRATKEVSVYLKARARGRGIGGRLYEELLGRLDADPAVHTQMAVIALPNDASEALHRRLGFERVGVLREVGHKLGRYVDTAWWQRLPVEHVQPAAERRGGGPR